MKLLTLDLLAYGPFTARSLQLGSAKTGFHVVFGGNEAGKSSALRALSALLYGVPGRTPDNFLHENSKLRIGGHLQHSNDTQIEFQRRKGNKNTLLTPQGERMDDGSLRDFLAGIDRARFEAVFGIDHERLTQGAQAILSGGGDVGESLFSAGVGTANLREVLDQLDTEADDLYKPRGSKPRINAALTAYKTSTKKVREHVLLSSRWTKQRKHLLDLQEKQHGLAADQKELKTEATRLERLRAVLPKLARRAELLAELQTLDGVVDLAEDFTERRAAAEQTLRAADAARTAAAQELKTHHDAVGRLDVPQGLIQEQVAVNTLYKDLGSFRKAQEDATKLVARQVQARANAQSLLEDLRPGVQLQDVEVSRPKTSTKARVRELAEQHQAIEAAPKHAVRNVSRYERELKAAKDALDALDAPRSVTPLRLLVARARKRGELEAAYQSASRTLANAREEAALALKGLGLWTGTLEECEALAVPVPETIELCQEQMVAAKTRVDGVATEIKTCEANLADQDENVKTLELSGAVMTEADLKAARKRRTLDWLQIRQAWLGESAPVGSDPEATAAADLPASYERHVEDADEVADRLRREAERVAKFAELEASRSRLQGELQRLEQSRDDAAASSRDIASQWAEVWAPLGMTPLSPREMRSWLTAHGRVVASAKAVREATRGLQSQQRDIEALSSELSAALEALGESALGETETLAAGLDRADLIVDSVAEVTRRRAALKTEIPARAKALEDARDVKKEAADALEAWRGQWAAAVSVLGLEASASPAEANAVLDKLVELFDKVEEARDLGGRLKGINRDAEAFTVKVDTLVQRTAADRVGRPTDQTVEVLHERLATAMADAATLQELKKRIKNLDTTIAINEANGKRTELELKALCSEAGCEQAAELRAAEQQSDRKADLSRRLMQLEDRITELGGGASVDALVSEADAIDPNSLPGEIEEIGRNTTALDEQRTALDKQIGSDEADFKRLDGSDAAAEEAAAAQAELAKLSTDLDRYVRVKLAAEMLRAEIERYREENQGPLLKRAGVIFSRLTLDSFVELGADYNDRDEPVLVGVRANDERVYVHGMSEGTADQLYLSIRLATLEQYLTNHEPIPFVVDDILVHFDDDRAFAALQVLAELSKKTQVLFFTHHARLVELAGKLGDGVVEVHQL